MSKREIKLLKDNTEGNLSDLERVQEFYDFLTGDRIPKGISIKRGHKPNMTAKQANSVIWFLQEHFSLIPDEIEQCDTCKIWYDSYCQGHYSELEEKCYCSESCEPPGLWEREKAAEKIK